MGNSLSVNAVPPPFEYARGEEDKIPFVPDGKDSVLGSTGTATRVRPKPGHFVGIDVAVRKTIRLMGTDEKQVDRDKKKIRMVAAEMSRMRHAHMLRTIATYFYDAHNGVQFSIVVEYISVNLQAYLASPMSVAASKTPPNPRWFGCLISVVAYLHSRGIRHGDIKPESILVRDSDTVLLSNFDLSEMDAWRTQQSTANLKWGRWKTTCGRYAAPEINEGPSRGRAADIFSLGAVFLELLLASEDRRFGSLGDSRPKMEELDGILSAPKKTGLLSYARSVHAVGSWLAGLSLPNSPAVVGGTELLSFCREMLDREPDARPRADELSSRWKSVVRSGPSLLQCSLCDECEPKQGDATDATRGPPTRPTLSSRSASWSSFATAAADTNTKSDSVGVGKTDGPRETDLFRAVNRGREDEVVALLNLQNSAVAVNAPNMEGWSALHCAARMNRRSIVALLLSKGASLELSDSAGWTALHFAARKGHRDVLKQLLEKDANFRATDKNGNTALHLAAEGGHVKAVALLLEMMDKADVNKTTNQGHSALWLAASGDHRDVLKLLVEYKKVDIRVLAR